MKKIITTPIGTAVFPHLLTPDTFKNQTKYKLSVEVTKEEAEAFKAKVLEAIKGEKFEVKNPKLPLKEGKEGMWLLPASSAYRPMLFDSRKNPLPDGVNVGGGSQVRVTAELYNYGDGISLRLRQVQVLKLVERSGTCEFEDVEDGYVAQTNEAEFEDDF